MMFEVTISLKKGIFDAEGYNTLKTLNMLNIKVNNITTAKVFRFDIDSKNEKEGYDIVKRAVDSLLVNPVLHDYTIKVVEPTKVKLRKV